MKIKFIRKIDELGRVVIPKDLVDMLDLGPDKVIEISVDGMCIIISKASEKNV